MDGLELHNFEPFRYLPIHLRETNKLNYMLVLLESVRMSGSVGGTSFGSLTVMATGPRKWIRNLWDEQTNKPDGMGWENDIGYHVHIISHYHIQQGQRGGKNWACRVCHYLGVGVSTCGCV